MLPLHTPAGSMRASQEPRRPRQRAIAYPRDFRGSRKRQLAQMRRAVWEGRVKYTSGRLTKNDLELNAKGHIVPKRRSRHSRVLCKGSGLTEWYESLRIARVGTAGSYAG